MTLLSKTLRVIKRDFVKKCLEISAETAEKIDDYIEFYEQSGKCLKRESHAVQLEEVRLPHEGRAQRHVLSLARVSPSCPRPCFCG